MIASVAPFGATASKRNFRRWSAAKPRCGLTALASRQRLPPGLLLPVRPGVSGNNVAARAHAALWNFIMTTTEHGSQSLAAGYVNRAGKSDRLPNFKSALPEPVLLPYCEPVASPFADPILSRIVGRCDA